MNTYCDDCKRCTGGNMRKSDVPGGDDHNRCWECEATLQAGMAEADAMISDLRAERDALLEQCENMGKALQFYADEDYIEWVTKGSPDEDCYEDIDHGKIARKALEVVCTYVGNGNKKNRV